MADGTKTPWHLWLVGVVSLLWNGFGGYDFIMSTTQGETYWRASGMTQPMIDYYNAMPTWMYGPWIIGVWGGLLGGILLLLRRKWATPVFVVSFLGWLAGAIYAFGLSNGLETMGSMWPMQIVIGSACVFFIWYAWAMGKRGVLR